MYNNRSGKTSAVFIVIIGHIGDQCRFQFFPVYQVPAYRMPPVHTVPVIMVRIILIK